MSGSATTAGAGACATMTTAKGMLKGVMMVAQRLPPGAVCIGNRTLNVDLVSGLSPSRLLSHEEVDDNGALIHPPGSAGAMSAALDRQTPLFGLLRGYVLNDANFVRSGSDNNGGGEHHGSHTGVSGQALGTRLPPGRRLPAIASAGPNDPTNGQFTSGIGCLHRLSSLFVLSRASDLVG